MNQYNVVVQSEESTVLTEYISKGKRTEVYQSEADLEREFINLLGELGYEYLSVKTEAELIPNLRKKIGRTQRLYLFRQRMGPIFQWLYCRQKRRHS